MCRVSQRSRQPKEFDTQLSRQGNVEPRVAEDIGQLGEQGGTRFGRE